MRFKDKKKAVLVLEDGTVFNGFSAGAIGTATGEIAFNTGMTGYQEVFTDPSYYGQILTMTSPHIGNYGVHAKEIESNSMKIAGLIVKNFSSLYSRPDAEGSLQEYCERDGVVAICNVDTRALVRHVRSKGAMNCIISSENLDIESLKSQLKDVPSMTGLELSSKVSCTEPYEVGDANAEHKVALLDLGVKMNIIRCLEERNCRVKVFPSNSKAEDLLAWNPEGIMLSNGPGDPSAMQDVINEVKKLVESDLPVYGICLGHQVLALSQGLGTEKMFNGHRGINHPILNKETGRGEITSQNHGFVVKLEDAESNPDIEVSHIHLNDNTLAGIKLKGKPVFSVQYHPEASAGPHDSRYLFDQFVENISVNKKETVQNA